MRKHNGLDCDRNLTPHITKEDREGATRPGKVLSSGSGFAEALYMRRLDAGPVGHWTFDGG